jgi:Prokaryotic phospholipase A2
MTRRIVLVLVLAFAALIPAGAASAATTTDKLTVLSTWTQPTATSTAAWNTARVNQGAWKAYNFDWSTDYCSDSPDNPLGFSFSMSCWHHDFGYRNYKAVGQFPANKARVDSMFYADLKRVCATYSSVLQPACYSLAWTYYEAVHVFGSIAKVDPAGIDKAARIKSESLRSAR